MLFYVLLIDHNSISWLRKALLTFLSSLMVPTGALRCKAPRGGYFVFVVCII